jgi:acyl-CoA thioester hydrolase
MIKLFQHIGKAVIVQEDMCDFNGHMNVLHIKDVFQQGWEWTTSAFGLNDEYFNDGFSTFTLEDNYRFQKEFLLGQSIFPRFRLHNLNKKLFHIVGGLFDEAENLCAIYETIEGHIDMNIRKIVPFREDKFQTMLEINKIHAATGIIPFDMRLKIKDLT